MQAVMRQNHRGTAPSSATFGSDDQSSCLGYLMIILAALLAVRLIGLDLLATDLFFDEAQYWSWSLDPAFGYYSKPPLIAWLIGSATAVCGHLEACIRAPGPLLHTATALLTFFLARSLYNDRVGFWAAIIIVTAPSVSLSSIVISTDAALLTCWTAALMALNRYLETGSWRAALALGVLIGIGLNAKYAMIYLPACTLVYASLTPRYRWIFTSPKSLLVLVTGAALLLPNLMWNLQNGMATFAHTKDNANWSGFELHFDRAAEFIGGQFGVFGPVMVLALLAMVVTGRRTDKPGQDRFLLFHSLPILALMIAQALFSRAHANWAATAYPAVAIVVVAWLLTPARQWLLAVSVAIRAAAVIVILVAGTAAADLRLPGIGRPFERVLGWQAAADKLRTIITQQQPSAMIFIRRRDIAEMLYYLRDMDVPLYAFKAEGRAPTDHFQLTRAWPTDRPGVALLVTPYADTSALPFAGDLELIHEINVSRGVSKSLKFRVHRLNR